MLPIPYLENNTGNYKTREKNEKYMTDINCHKRR